MKLIVLCAEGLQEVVLEEIREYGNVKEYEKYFGSLIIDYIGKPQILKKIKTADDILYYAREYKGINRYRHSLNKLRQQSKKIPLSNITKITNREKTFIVKATYKGRRDYKADEIQDAVAEGIEGSGWIRNIDAEHYIHIILTEDISLCGISIEKMPLHAINKVPHTVPGSLRPSVANAMINLANITKNDFVIDPMCGSGVIPIYASFKAKQVLAGDIEESILKKAYRNIHVMQVPVKLYLWDALSTELEDNSVDRVISNLPFQKQVDIQGKNFFNRFIKEMTRITKNKATLVFLTRNEEKITQGALDHNIKVKKTIPIINSGLKSEIVILEK